MENSEFQIGDMVYLKSDIHRIGMVIAFSKLERASDRMAFPKYWVRFEVTGDIHVHEKKDLELIFKSVDSTFPKASKNSKGKV